MIPKKIHLCWFSGDPYPVEIKICLDTWKKLLPDYEVRLWDYQAAKAIGCSFIDEALEERRWAFAADAVRFYAVYTEGGVYMDSDIFLRRRFDELLDAGEFVTFNEHDNLSKEKLGLQAAFFMGAVGNTFCKEAYNYYQERHYRNADGTFNDTISPYVMLGVAEKYGYLQRDEKQILPALTVYPTHFVAPNNHYPTDGDTIGVHRIMGSWRKRSAWRKLELAFKHLRCLVAYKLSHQ